MSAPVPAEAPPRSKPGLGVMAALMVSLNMFRAAMERAPEGGLLGPEAMGSAVVPLLLAAVVYGLAYVIGRRQTRRRRACVATICAMSVIFIVNPAKAGRRAPNALPAGLTDAERADLVAAPTGLHHPALGFGLPHPGPGFVRDSIEERVLNEHFRVSGIPVFSWLFARRDPMAVASVYVLTEGNGNSGPEALRNFAAPIRDATADPRAGRVLMDTVFWQLARMEYRFTFQHRSGAFIKMRCVPAFSGERKPIAICAMIAAHDTATLNVFLDGLAVDVPAVPSVFPP